VRYSPLDRVAGLGVPRRRHQDGGAMMARPGPGSHFLAGRERLFEAVTWVESPAAALRAARVLPRGAMAR